MKTIEEQIAVMQYYANGGEVEVYDKTHDNWIKKDINSFNWIDRDYRIKEQKKIVTIEKWICKDGDNSYFVEECSHIEGYEKVRLLETYEVEI